MKPWILSVDEIDDAAGLTKASIKYFWEKYEAPKDDLRYSPLLQPESEWRGVTQKAYFAICGWDPRRDEAMLFARFSNEQGLVVRNMMYEGLPHGFWATCPELEISEGWERDVVGAIKWMLDANGG